MPVKAALALIVIGLVAAVAAAWSGAVLADVYRPHAAGVELTDPGSRRVDVCTAWHLRATWVFLAAAIGCLAAVAWLVMRAALHRAVRVVAPAGLLVASTAAVVILLTQRLVAYQQLALRSVTTGSHIQGYWFAAFDQDVLYLLVDGVEVAQDEYAPVLVAHLAAPVIGAIALVISGSALLRSARRSIAAGSGVGPDQAAKASSAAVRRSGSRSVRRARSHRWAGTTGTSMP